jgi:chromosome segregation ATPase
MLSEENNMTTRQVEHVDTLMDRLRQAADEIDQIKTSFCKSTENLSRIQNMLDVGGLQQIGGIIEKFEGKLIEAERKREEAAEGARRYSEELEKEKERLIKLWDAYKNQEEELSKNEKRLTDLEEQVRIADESKKQLEDDLSARISTLTTRLEAQQEELNHLDDYKQRCDEFTAIRNSLEEETQALKEQINQKTTSMQHLENQVKELKELEQYREFKEKFDDVSQRYEKEKERLTKLYHLYEETENECKMFKQESEQWRQWFNSNKQIFDKLFSAAPPLEIMMQKEKTKTEEHKKETHESSKKEDTSKEKRKKLRFKK